MKNIVPVILSGGSGTRLWPLSRSGYPKQFLELSGNKSLFEQALERVGSSYGFEDAIVVANQDHRFIVQQQAKRVDAGLQEIILEPIGRNTAPAVAVAALMAEKIDPKAKLLFLAADHVIQDVPGFHKAVEIAAKAADQGKLVCFGIKPTRPDISYGYLRQGDALENIDGAFSLSQFREKPDLATAQEYFNSGQYSWNSGMFMFRADVVLSELEKCAPEILAGCKAALDSAEEDLDFCRLDEAIFREVYSDSIDYALMEKTTKAVVVPAEMSWSDVGSYSAMWAIKNKDEQGNACFGDTIMHDTKDCFIYGEDRLISAVGVEDLIIVSTDDVVMVAHKSRDQDVKALVNHVKEKGRPESELHTKVYRPWGNYHSLAHGGGYQVKEIEVYPGKRLSLQKHSQRAEHWVILEGTATVTRDDEIMDMNKDESIFLPLGCVHRLENKTDGPVRLIEVQSGSYLGEDDIVRLEDDFNRSSDD